MSNDDETDKVSLLDPAAKFGQFLLSRLSNVEQSNVLSENLLLECIKDD